MEQHAESGSTEGGRLAVLSFLLERLPKEHLEKILATGIETIPGLDLKWTDGAENQHYSELWHQMWKDLNHPASLGVAKELREIAHRVLEATLSHRVRLDVPGEVQMSTERFLQSDPIAVPSDFVLSPDEMSVVLIGNEKHDLYRRNDPNSLIEISSSPYAFSSDGKYIASVSKLRKNGNFLYVLRVSDGGKVGHWRLGAAGMDVLDIDFLGAPHVVVVTARDRILIVDPAVPVEVRTIYKTGVGSQVKLSEVFVSSNQRRIFFKRNYSDFRSGMNLWMLKLDEKDKSNSLKWIGNYVLHASLSKDRSLLTVVTLNSYFLIDTFSGETIHSKSWDENSGIVIPLRITPDGRCFLGNYSRVGCDEMPFGLYDTAVDSFQPLILEHSIEDVELSPDSNWMMLKTDMASEASSWQLWNLPTQRQLVTLRGYKQIQFMADSRRVLGLSIEGELQIVNLGGVMDQFAVDFGGER
jgi:hypothetical protein